MVNGKGERQKGIVTGITNFGAFIRLEDGKTGLVHISQISEQYVRDVHDHLTVGQEVTVRILSTDENGRIALTMKEPKNCAESGGQPGYFEVSVPPADFESMMIRYKSTSEERLSDLRRSQRNGRSSVKRKK